MLPKRPLPHTTPTLFNCQNPKLNQKAISQQKVFELLNPLVAAELKALNVIEDYEHLYEMLDKYNTPFLKKAKELMALGPDQLSVEDVLCLSAEEAAYKMAKARYEKNPAFTDKMIPAVKYVFFSSRSDLWVQVLKEKNAATLDKELIYITAALGGNVPFFKAINTPVFKELINKVLVAATMSGSVELMRLCIDKLGADPKAARLNDLNLVVIALIFNHVEAVRYAFNELKLPAEYRAGTNWTPFQVNALLISASLGSLAGMKMAVSELGIAADSKDINENNALNVALQAGEEAAVDYALNDLKLTLDNSRNRFDQHPLNHAILSGKVALVEKIAKKLNLSADHLPELNEMDKHPGFYAVVACDAKLLQWVHEHYRLSADLLDDRENNLFLEACCHGNLTAARFCIDVLQINPHATDKFGFNALHHAGRSDNLALMRYLVEDLQVDSRQLTQQGYAPIDFANNKKSFYYLRLLGLELTHPWEEKGRRIDNTPLLQLANVAAEEMVKEVPELADVRPLTKATLRC